MLSFSQHCHDQRALTSLSEEATKKQALHEHKHILFNTRTPTEIVEYETKLMHKKAKLLPENLLANKAYEASKLSGVFTDTKAASCLLFNCYNELNRLDEMVSGDIDRDSGKTSKCENGAITYTPSEVIKKRLKQKAIKNLQESHAPLDSYEYEVLISEAMAKRELAIATSIAWLVRNVNATHSTIKDIHYSLKKNPSQSSVALSKIRKAKANGDTKELLSVIAGVLAFNISGKVSDIARD